MCEPKLACTSGVHEFVMSLAVEPKCGDPLVLSFFVKVSGDIEMGDGVFYHSSRGTRTLIHLVNIN